MQICLFDIDGTLLRSGGAGKAAMEGALQETFNVPLAVEQVSYSGRTDRAIGRDLFRLHGIELNEANWQRFIYAYLDRLPACLVSMRGVICPGIAELLDELATWPDIAVGLLTGNLRAGAQVKLGHFGLYERFLFGGFGDHHWERDDVAFEAVQALCLHLERPIEPERIWVIGDTPLDIQCARAIGARAVAVATGWDAAEVLAAAGPDLLLEDLADPAPFLRQLELGRLARGDLA
ncbi:MAG TPA: HAD family hydrolase [Gemmataceae bacterium]|jgi:phosphoglycolate phosphatase-like HAD superfamily hydrolase|nr:HAD family hydrolase [Gemmataceae bacterium]